uniref:hypothetical protein n=1 Tax=Salmonella enterica TaxID=28901 RepID=UPI00398C27B4
ALPHTQGAASQKFRGLLLRRDVSSHYKTCLLIAILQGFNVPVVYVAVGGVQPLPQSEYSVALRLQLPDFALRDNFVWNDL